MRVVLRRDDEAPGHGSPAQGLPSAVFVVGSPRSGTTFLGHALGQMDGFVDAGELLAEQLPRLYDLPPQQAAEEIREGIATAGHQLGGALRPVIHTPEMVFVTPAVLALEPAAVVIQSIRDCRDVAASLIDQGWLASRRDPDEQPSPDPPRADAHKFAGDTARYWTEPSRLKEFAAVSEARRAAWLWRRTVLAGLRLVRDPERTVTLRYEQACADLDLTARRLSTMIGVPLEQVQTVLAPMRADSVGRWKTHLTTLQLHDIYREAGELLGFLRFPDLPGVFDPELAELISSADTGDVAAPVAR